MLKGCIAGTKKRVITLRKVSSHRWAGELEPHGLWGFGSWPALSLQPAVRRMGNGEGEREGLWQELGG